MTIEDLIDKLDELESAFKFSNISLEEYWRSLYPLVLKAEHVKPTLILFFELIKDSIISLPIDLDPTWLSVLLTHQNQTCLNLLLRTIERN